MVNNDYHNALMAVVYLYIRLSVPCLTLIREHAEGRRTMKIGS